MARITVTDCLQNVDNRFQLVLVASKRARQINLGAEAMVEPDNDKPSVIALREIAAGYVDRRILDNNVPLSAVEYETKSEEEYEQLSNELFDSGSAESSQEVETNT